MIDKLECSKFDLIKVRNVLITVNEYYFAVHRSMKPQLLYLVAKSLLAASSPTTGTKMKTFYTRLSSRPNVS